MRIKLSLLIKNGIPRLRVTNVSKQVYVLGQGAANALNIGLGYCFVRMLTRWKSLLLHKSKTK